MISTLARFRRIAICGGPRRGKSTLAAKLGRPVVATDDLMGLPWTAIPAAVISRASMDRCVVEGVQVARALRRGLEVDAVVYLLTPKVQLSPGQLSMGKAIHTIFTQWELATRGQPNRPEIYYLQ